MVTEERPYEDTGWSWPPTSLGERPPKTLTLTLPGSGTSGHQNYEKIHYFCCVCHPVCGSFLQKPQQTNTLPHRIAGRVATMKHLNCSAKCSAPQRSLQCCHI